MNSVSIGRAVVIDAAVEEAFAAPLQESVKSAAQRAALKQSEGRKRKEDSITQNTYGKDVTELLKDLEEAERAASEKSAAKRRKAVSDASKRASQADCKV